MLQNFGFPYRIVILSKNFRIHVNFMRFITFRWSVIIIYYIRCDNHHISTFYHYHFNIEIQDQLIHAWTNSTDIPYINLITVIAYYQQYSGPKALLVHSRHIDGNLPLHPSAPTCYRDFEFCDKSPQKTSITLSTKTLIKSYKNLNLSALSIEPRNDLSRIS